MCQLFVGLLGTQVEITGFTVWSYTCCTYSRHRSFGKHRGRDSNSLVESVKLPRLQELSLKDEQAGTSDFGGHLKQGAE